MRRSQLCTLVLAVAIPIAMPVRSQSIHATPESGTADAGMASKAIVSVTANDTVNGEPATLGTSGNATVAKVGTWPSGVALNKSNGAITTATSTQAGAYTVRYRLCDKNVPANCAAATDGLTVIVASLVAAPDAGTAVTGIAATVIANVAANDTINGAVARLGPGGNASVAKAGKWPTGIALDPLAGSVSTTAFVPTATYSIAYRLCDMNRPSSCTTATDTVAVAPASTEVQASSLTMVDIEFDWGRDGVYCATCNLGQGNARFNWSDQEGNLWVGHVDPSSGAFTPAAGNSELADSSAFYYSVFGNGPEWAFSTQDGQIISQLVYTRYTPGTSAVAANAGAAFATPVASGWSANFFPGTAPVSGGANATVNPLASQCNTDPVAYAYFYGLADPQNLYWEPVSTAPGTTPALTPFAGAYNVHRNAQKPSIRWVPCTHQLVYVAPTPPDPLGVIYQQVFWYDTDSGVSQQLTFEPANHAEAFMFQAPEFGDAYVLVTLSNSVQIEIYGQAGFGDNGAPNFQLANQVVSTDAAEPFIGGIEPFINCTPTCQTYLFMELRSLSSQQSSGLSANGVAVANISPTQPLFNILAPQAATPNIQRIDLEYYITAHGPYLYYDRNTASSATSRFAWGNRYYIDMQLGAPSGPCVGSSAEGGMLPGC